MNLTSRNQHVHRLAIALFMFGGVMVGNFSAESQTKTKRLQPGKLYDPGETIYAPRYGFTSVVPAMWQGTLPMNEEVFLLVPDTTSIGGEIFTFASDKNDIESLRQNWLKGVALSESISMKASDIKVEGDKISSEVVPAGDAVNTGNKGYAVARCNPFGGCITSLAIGPVQCYDDMKKAVESFMTSASFSEPKNISMYADFSWKEFLSDKILISFMVMQDALGSGQKENNFHLCADGTFEGKIKKKGSMKGLNSDYKGNQTGTWSTESVGDTGVLKLNFKKLPPVELTMHIKEDRITVNGEKYFVAESDKCKKK